MKRYLRWLPVALTLAIGYAHWWQFSRAVVDRWMGKR